MLSLSVLVIGPLFVVAISYFLVANYVKENSLKRNDNEASEQTKSKHAKFVQRLTVLVMCYIACLLPLIVNFFFEVKNGLAGTRKSLVDQTLTVMPRPLSLFNSVLNPIIYVAKFPRFRKAFNPFTTGDPPGRS